MGAKYSAVSAKLKAMYSKFLTPQDYEHLIEQKSVRDICSYLKNLRGFDEILEGVNPEDIHRGQMELLIDGGVLDDYTRIFKFTGGSNRYILKYWFMHHEVEFLIREIQYIYTHEERNKEEVNNENFEFFFSTHTKIDRDGMDKAKSIADCVQACRNTPYYKPLKRAEKLDSEFFSVSMMLEKFYYSSLWRDINTKLPKDQRELFRLLIGSKIDALNIMWIYRGKKFFDFSEELIFTYLIPVHYRIDEKSIKKLVRSENIQAFINAVRDSAYAKLFLGVEDGVYPEENYRKMVKDTAKRVFTNHSESLAAIFAFLYLKEFEAADIKTVIETVRYKTNSDAVRKRLNI